MFRGLGFRVLRKLWDDYGLKIIFLENFDGLGCWV
jgi:hypothetical protein